MPADLKSFKDLLAAAPAADEGRSSLTGLLARSSDPGKFVLTLADGHMATLDVDAVKGHTVLCGSAGQTIVRVDLDPARVPADAKAAGFGTIGTGSLTAAALDQPFTLAWWDHPGTAPAWDLGVLGTGVADLGGPVTLAETVSQPGTVGDPTINSAAAVVPFGLATPHQSAAAAALAAQGLGGAAPRFGSGGWGRRKIIQDGGKFPEEDLTTPPHYDI